MSHTGNTTKVVMDYPGDWRERRLANQLGVNSTPSIFVMESNTEGEKAIRPVVFHGLEKNGKHIQVVSPAQAIQSINNQDN